MLKNLKRFDKWLDSHIVLLLLLALLLLLRLPNFFEPYWYGDEGIYLTIGNGLRQGKILYSQIIDHKTPLIYYLAAVGSQLQFRLLTFIWMSLASIAFFHLAKELLQKTWTIIAATAIFILLTSLPYFEGNIPNGELFVMGFVLWGAYFMSGTKVFNDYFSAENTLLKNIGIGNKEESLSAFLPAIFKRDRLLYAIAGFFFGLAILTKIPALFDAAAFFALFCFTLTNSFSLRKNKWFAWFKQLRRLSIDAAYMLAGLIFPILLSIFYFTLRGAGRDYLDFGLLYNFRYAGSWHPSFVSPLLEFIFTLPGKILLSVVLITLLVLLKKIFRPVFQFVATWFILTLFAALLSNRPYPHYFLQIMPALSLLVVLFFDSWLDIKLVNKKIKLQFVLAKIKKAEADFTLLLLAIFVSVALLLHLGLYPTLSYYTRFTRYITGSMSLDNYYASFNPFMKDNYEASRVILNSGEREIFIWGTNPMLYALSQTSPVGKFTVSFHIKDFQAQAQTLAALKEKRPYFIVVMKDEKGQFPGFYEFLQNNYMPNQSFEHFTLWKLL